MIKYYLSLALLLSIGAAYAQQPAYKNKNLSPEVRAKDILAGMILSLRNYYLFMIRI